MLRPTLRITTPIIVITALLVWAFWLTFVHLRNSQFGLLNLDYRGSSSQLSIPRRGDLLAGDMVAGQFVTPYPNLGLISVRFYNQDRDSDDILVFRLRRTDNPNWLYEHTYESNQFLPHQYFSFGFPIMSDSAGQSYTFELESTRGATGSGILIDQTDPVYIAKSVFDRSTLLSSSDELFYWFVNKVINLFADHNLFIHISFYFLPFFFYILYLLTSGISYQPLTIFVFAIVIYDAFFSSVSYDHLYLGLSFLWALLIHRYRFNSQISSGVALVLLIFTPTLILFGRDIWSERIAVWAFLYLTISVFQQVYESRRPLKSSLTIKKFISQFTKFSYDSRPFGTRFLLSLITPGLIILFLYYTSRSIALLIHAFELYKSFYPANYLGPYLIFVIIPIVLVSLFVVYISNYFRPKISQPRLRYIITFLVWMISISWIVNLSTVFRDKTHLIKILPQTVSEAWVDVAIYGHNFSEMPFVGKVEIDGVEQRIIRWSDKLIYFRTEPGHTHSGNLCVILHDDTKSDCLPFTYLFGQQKTRPRAGFSNLNILHIYVSDGVNHAHI